MKQCNCCKQNKTIEFFSRDKSRKDGLSGRCKDCQSKLSKLHHLTNKEKYKISRLRHKDKRRKLLRDTKSKPCVDCGIEYPYWIMQFDHLKDKEFTIGYEAYRTTLKALKEEIAKCEVVCANCHAHRTWTRLTEN